MLPNISVYGVLVPLAAPIFDVLFVFYLFTNLWQEMVVAYLMFTFFDLVYALVGFAGESGRRKLIWVLLLQRFYYRQLLLFALIKSVIKAVSGTHASWGKLKRVGHAQEYFTQKLAGTLPADI